MSISYPFFLREDADFWLHQPMKKFWRILKKVLTVAGVLTCAGLFLVVLTSAIKKQNKLVCRNIQVKIDDQTGITFVSENEIREQVSFLVGGNITGKPFADLNLRMLEKEVEKNPFIARAEIYVNQRQDMVVSVVQRRPVIRVINNDGVGYYLGENDERIPLNDKFTPHVAVALGFVATHQDSKRDSTVQSALYQLIQKVRRDDFLNALVDQVYVQENGEMDLLPKVGAGTIHIGRIDEGLNEKFDLLKIFYKDGLTKAGWTKYKTIDLRFTDQVVCEKKGNTNKI